jgi:hypothetical protein
MKHSFNLSIPTNDPGKAVFVLNEYFAKLWGLFDMKDYWFALLVPLFQERDKFGTYPGVTFARVRTKEYNCYGFIYYNMTLMKYPTYEIPHQELSNDFFNDEIAASLDIISDKIQDKANFKIELVQIPSSFRHLLLIFHRDILESYKNTNNPRPGVIDYFEKVIEFLSDD